MNQVTHQLVQKWSEEDTIDKRKAHYQRRRQTEQPVQEKLQIHEVQIWMEKQVNNHDAEREHEKQR
jgi:hypothetical protein